MTRKTPPSLRRTYIDAFLDRGVAGLGALGFQEARFEGVYPGRDPQGHFVPMLRQTGPLLEILTVLFAHAQPQMPIVQVYAGLFDGDVPPQDALDGARIIDFLMAAQRPPYGRFPLLRTGWRAIFDGARRYGVRPRATGDTATEEVARAVGRILTDAAALPQTRRVHLRRNGLWVIAFRDGSVVPERHLPRGSAALKTVLAEPPLAR